MVRPQARMVVLAACAGATVRNLKQIGEVMSSDGIDVLFENIWIEHCYDKLIDSRISRSRCSTDKERGRIRNVRIKGARWTTNYANAGYTLSVIGGWDAEHRVEEVLIEDFQVDGSRIRSLDELEITTRHCMGVTIGGRTGFMKCGFFDEE